LIETSTQTVFVYNKNVFTPQYSWNITKVGVKHQSIIVFATKLVIVLPFPVIGLKSVMAITD
jgi:hypothetical protein